MKVVIQRVSQAQVTVDSNIVGSINEGLLVLIGFTHEETVEDMEWVIHKILNLRIFDDAKGVMNLSVVDKDAQLLVVSQFTLFAQTKKGNRPSYIQAAPPEIAKKYYDLFLQVLQNQTHLRIECGIFGALMQVELLNNGPVTIIIDSKNRE